VITLPGAAPAAGDSIALTIPAAALVDSFLNQPAGPYALTFTWPAGDAVLADLAPPTIQRLTLRAGALELELSTEPAAGTLSAIQLDGASVAWTLAADHYTLTSSAGTVAAGSHVLTIATSLTDLGGNPLALAFSQAFTVATPTDTQALFEAPDPQEVTTSAVGNVYGFQGLPLDPETGLIYVRNRYYDPQIGRFITADPKGYVDGPSEYAFETDNPANGSDPMGLEVPSPNLDMTPALSLTGFLVGVGESALETVAAPVLDGIHQTALVMGAAQRMLTAYKRGGAAAAKEQMAAEGKAESKRSGQALLGMIPGINTVRRAARITETYEKDGPLAGGRQLGRTTISLAKDAAVIYRAAKGFQSPAESSQPAALEPPPGNHITRA
jgi:RHS repeat-associated protein